MSDTTSPPKPPAVPWNSQRLNDSGARITENLVRETWRHYYVAQLAEAQFGPASLEASIARSRALASYRDLRTSLREIDPYYRPATARPASAAQSPRHLSLVRDEPPPMPDGL